MNLGGKGGERANHIHNTDVYIHTHACTHAHTHIHTHIHTHTHTHIHTHTLHTHTHIHTHTQTCNTHTHTHTHTADLPNSVPISIGLRALILVPVPS